MANPMPVESIHASIARTETLLAERRALCALAIEMAWPDGAGVDVPDVLLDSPVVRYHVGQALAGRVDVPLRELVACAEEVGETVAAAGVPVVRRPAANDALSAALDTFHTGGVRLLTEKDPRFAQAFDTVEAGVQLARELSPMLVDDLLPHVNLFAILDPDTSNGLVSASSRWVPGLVVVAPPATPVEVTEALVHEGAHQKFFDLAITRSFFSFEADDVEEFETSWSHARWPMEQTVAAWHAYTCMHRFAMDAGLFSGRLQVGGDSLLPDAAARAVEIGEWLVAHELYMQADARRLLNGLLLRSGSRGRGTMGDRPLVIGRLKLDPLVRFGSRELRGRGIVAREGTPLEIYWIDPIEYHILQLISSHGDGLHVDEIVAHQAASWGVDTGAAQERVAAALPFLRRSKLIVHPENCP